MQGLSPHIWVLIFLRVLYSLTTLTYGVPDEHWQGPEVAHRLVFGPGYRTWEWEPGTALRSYTYPLLLSTVFWPLVGLEWCIRHTPLLSGAQRVWVAQRVFLPLLWYAPRAFATACTLGVDVALYTLTDHAFGGRAAWWATTLYATSWFSILASARPLSNGAEAALTLWALALWWWGSGSMGRAPWHRGGGGWGSSTAAIGWAGGLVGLSLLIRPTSALVWAVVAAGVVWSGRVHSLVGVVLTKALPCFFAVLLGLTVGLDWVLYGRPTFPAWTFLSINSLQGWSALYGTHPWHWYFSNAIPASLNVTLPLLLHSLWEGQWRGGAPLPSLIAGMALGTALLHSLSSHKEDRYLSTVLPLLYVFIGASAATLSDARGVPQWAKALAFALFLAINLPTGLYLNMHHQRGAVAAVEALAYQAAMATYRSSSGGTSNPEAVLLSAHFIMPCHSTPFHSHVHYPGVELRQLDCSPTSRLLSVDGPFHGGHVCRYSGCCGVEGRPPFTETSALESNGGGLLRAVYGSGDPNLYTLPHACTQGGANSAHTLSTSPYLTHPLGFAQEFAPKGCGGGGGGGGGGAPPPYHPLPTHLLLFDTDARRPEVTQWLTAANFSWETMQAFPHSPLFQGDSHASRQHPKEVLLFTHPCWTAAWEHTPR